MANNTTLFRQLIVPPEIKDPKTGKREFNIDQLKIFFNDIANVSYSANTGGGSSGSSNLAYNQANAAYTQANTALIDAESAYNQANNVLIIAEEAYTTANGKTDLHGFEYDSPNNAWFVTLSYNSATRQLSITPTTSNYSVWVNGVQHNFAGVQTTPPHGVNSSAYFVYYDSSGNLQMSATPWDLLTQCPVSYIIYNANSSPTPTAEFLLFECHLANGNPALHKALHFGQGTRISSNPGLPVFGGFTLGAALGSANVTFSATPITIIDEDIELPSNSLVAGTGPYRIFYLNGAGADITLQSSTFADGNSIPFLDNGTQICYNQFTGGVWQKTALTLTGGGQFVNQYLCATTENNINSRYFLMTGQAVYASLAAAQAEAPSSIYWGSVPLAELVIVARFTYQGATAFGATTHYTTLQGVQYISGFTGASSISGATTTPGGINTSIQFNNSGSFGGTSNLTFDIASNTLSIGANANVGNLNVFGALINVTGIQYLSNLVASNTSNLSITVGPQGSVSIDTILPTGPGGFVSPRTFAFYAA